MNSIYVFLWTSMRIAIRQLFRHKVRSFLTMLGIIIGVGAVVTIVSLGEGLRGMFMKNIASQSSADLIYVMPDVPMNSRHIYRPMKPFKNRDVDAIKASEYVTQVIAGNIADSVVIKHGWRSDNAMCQMVPHTYFPMDNWIIERGRTYNTSEERGRATVCVVGGEIGKAVYETGEDVLGSKLQVNGVRFTVIGVMKTRSAMEGGEQANKMVFIPLETGQDRITGNDEIYWVAAKVRDSKELLAAKDDLSYRLRASRRIRKATDDDFKISTPDDWAKFANTFVNTLIMVFGVVAVIALIVGGIGVMNIMLVSVRERTREIGLRKALGATSLFITWQFLVEAMTLTMVGGMIGLLTGYGLGGVAAIIMKMTLKVSWAPSVPMGWIIAVFLTSIGLGITFGVYPAWRAGKLDPIIALRYE
jgi:putative ABC transport system permease protein